MTYGKHEIHGSLSQFKKSDRFLQVKPEVSWNAALGTCTLVAIDPDAPDRDGDDGTRAGAFGPWLHWLASECEGGMTISGKQHVSYMGPAPPRGNHRYIFVLFQQLGGVKLAGGIQRKQWDLEGFVTANRGVLKAAAVNFYYCSST